MSRVLPILFNTEMVRAILDGRKTVTRRPVRYKYSNTEMKMRTDKYGTRLIEIEKDVKGKTYGKNSAGRTWHKLRGYIEPTPPYKPGDTLYVRETWSTGYEEGTYIYKADDKLAELPTFKESSKLIWHPSIHMPKEAARIWLKVTDVRVERLHDITNEQMLEEGANQKAIKHYMAQMPYKTAEWIYAAHAIEFSHLWDSTIKKPDLERYGWNSNPWVWVIEFERCEKPVELTIGQ